MTSLAALLLVLVAVTIQRTNAWLPLTRRSHALSNKISTSTKLFMSQTPKFVSSISSSINLQDAVNEVIDQIQSNSPTTSYTTAIFFASTAYEAAAFQYDIIIDAIRSKLPSISSVIGCTTGGGIGAADLSKSTEPVEIESRASLSAIFLDAGASSQVKIERFEQSQVEEIAIKGSAENVGISKGLQLIFATENVRPFLTNFMNEISKKETQLDIFGGFSSSVNSYQKPKVFAYSTSSNAKLDRFTDGLVSLSLSGDIGVSFLIARSCVPVGPMFQITGVKNSEITSLKRFDPNLDDTEELPPLVQLENVINEINVSEKYGLTRELLLSCVQKSMEIYNPSNKITSIVKEVDFFSQKPTSFDPYTGSITVSCIPKLGGTFQFCVRDNSAAHKGVAAAQKQLSQIVEGKNKVHPSAVVLIGSGERGNKVFRYQSWESLQLYHSLKDQGITDVPIAGFFSHGAFARLQLPTSSSKLSSLMEADSLYAIISPGTSSPLIPSPETNNQPDDIMTAFELKHFCDENATIMVDKSQTESSNTVRVAGMDYLVPDKMPQARFVLEQLVWERSKDADRLRERFPMARALTQAKAAEGKFPRRDVAAAVLKYDSHARLPPVVIELHRSSIHNGKLLHDPNAMADQMRRLTKSSMLHGVVAMGVQTDISFTGLYEDLEAVKKSCEFPVICNDFVLFGYQLFRAKAGGADSIKLLASVLSPHEMSYLVKTAKAIGLTTIVVVATKAQLLDVLQNVAGISMISVTSRNHFLWKIDHNKADRILADDEVKKALVAWKKKDANAIVFQEGFSCPEDIVAAKNNPIDAVILGEEVLANCPEGKDAEYEDALKYWLSTA